MKLSTYAKLNGICYRTAWLWYKDGKIPGATLTATGRVHIPDDIVRGKVDSPEKRVAIYTRVSSSENKNNLDSQAERLSQYAIARGWPIVSITKEIGSGINDERKKLHQLLSGHDWDILLVEHKDRLTRFGFNLIETLVKAQGKQIDVANRVDEQVADTIQDMVSIVYSFSARIYGQRRAKNKAKAVLKVLEAE